MAQIISIPLNPERTVKPLGLSKKQRINKSTEFDRIYDRKLRVFDSFLLVFAARNECDFTRFGLSVSRKHGNAIERNRLKRLLREAFRLSQHKLPSGWDLVLIPRQKTDATLDDFRNSLLQLTEDLQRTFEKKNRVS